MKNLTLYCFVRYKNVQYLPLSEHSWRKMQRRYWSYLDNRTERPHLLFLLIGSAIFSMNALQTTKIISATITTMNLC
jgi:hypothetical protein